MNLLEQQFKNKKDKYLYQIINVHPMTLHLLLLLKIYKIKDYLLLILTRIIIHNSHFIKMEHSKIILHKI